MVPHIQVVGSLYQVKLCRIGPGYIGRAAGWVLPEIPCWCSHGLVSDDRHGPADLAGVLQKEGHYVQMHPWLLL